VPAGAHLAGRMGAAERPGPVVASVTDAAPCDA
jgi:hypothetical protein